MQSRGNSANHTMFGPIMSKYLERMAKSNDQILRLAELISKEEENDQEEEEEDTDITIHQPCRQMMTLQTFQEVRKIIFFKKKENFEEART